MAKHQRNDTDLLRQMFASQNDFSKLFFDRDDMSDAEKQRMTLVFAASLNKEVASLLDGINYKEHRLRKKNISKSTILFESVDIFRYLLATLNLWNVSPTDFADAFEDRDRFLNLRHKLESQKWQNQPVLIFDLDDVVADFKNGFADWLEQECNLNLNRQGREYYFSKELVEAGHTPDELFTVFIEKRQLKELVPLPGVIDVINRLHDEGYWIQFLTSRPKENLVCRYDTYSWLSLMGVKFHRISFSPEKYLWLSRTDFLKSGKVVCAVDDSAKHCMEYVKHHVPTVARRTSYNVELADVEGVKHYDTAEELYDHVKKLHVVNQHTQSV